jgi:nicotinamidase-related amidase
MALTTLDPNTALIVIDLQKGIAGYPLIHPIDEVVEQTCALLDAFRGRGLPIVLVNDAGRAPGRMEQGPRASFSFSEGWADFLPGLDQQPNDIVAKSA